MKKLFALSVSLLTIFVCADVAVSTEETDLPCDHECHDVKTVEGSDEEIDPALACSKCDKDHSKK